MMDFLKHYRNVSIGVAVAVFIFAAYFYWKSSGEIGDESILTYTEGPAVEEAFVGQEILRALNDLRRLKIDGSIFQSGVFKSLIDYSAATTSEAIGRPDPFAPFF